MKAATDNTRRRGVAVLQEHCSQKVGGQPERCRSSTPVLESSAMSPFCDPIKNPIYLSSSILNIIPYIIFLDFSQIPIFSSESPMNSYFLIQMLSLILFKVYIGFSLQEVTGSPVHAVC